MTLGASLTFRKSGAGSGAACKSLSKAAGDLRSGKKNRAEFDEADRQAQVEQPPLLPTPYLKMRVLGAIDMAQGHSIQARIQAVIRLAANEDWLNKATKEVAKYWRHKRERRENPRRAPHRNGHETVAATARKVSPKPSPSDQPNGDERAMASDE